MPTPKPEPLFHCDTLITELPGVVAAGTTVKVLTPTAEVPEPFQTFPLIDVGVRVVTVTLVVATTVPHELVTAYEITALPTATPVTIPDEDPTVAIDVDALVHTPPLTAFDSVEVPPTNIAVVPVIVPAVNGITVVVTVLVPVATQPLTSVTLTV